MIDRHSSYRPADTMRDLLRENNMLLNVISRFGIGFGFGDLSIRETCRENNVDAGTFLAVCNLLSGREHEQYEVELGSLMEYLRLSHMYYMEVSLPRLRMRMIEAINTADTKDVSILLIRFFDDYAAELKAHLDQENQELFPYIEGLLSDRVPEGFSSEDFKTGHTPVTEKLQELKDIFIYHYTNGANMLLSAVLFDIVTLEHDLTAHFEVENHLLVPALEALERQRRSEPRERDEESAPMASIAALGEREKEIVRLIARGKSNKEIADELFLSVHTVATHRKNIISKTGIHSTAGLTIFAILHGLIEI